MCSVDGGLLRETSQCITSCWAVLCPPGNRRLIFCFRFAMCNVIPERIQQLSAWFRLPFVLRSAMGSSKMCQCDKDGRSIILKYWQGGSETDSGKGQLTVNVYQGMFSSQQSGFLVRCLMLMGIVGDFQPFLIISSLQKRQCLFFNLCFAHSKNPQPETF